MSDTCPACGTSLSSGAITNCTFDRKAKDNGALVYGDGEGHLHLHGLYIYDYQPWSVTMRNRWRHSMYRLTRRRRPLWRIRGGYAVRLFKVKP